MHRRASAGRWSRLRSTCSSSPRYRSSSDHGAIATTRSAFAADTGAPAAVRNVSRETRDAAQCAAARAVAEQEASAAADEHAAGSATSRASESAHNPKTKTWNPTTRGKRGSERGARESPRAATRPRLRANVTTGTPRKRAYLQIRYALVALVSTTNAHTSIGCCADGASASAASRALAATALASVASARSTSASIHTSGRAIQSVVAEPLPRATFPVEPLPPSRPFSAGLRGGGWRGMPLSGYTSGVDRMMDIVRPFAISTQTDARPRRKTPITGCSEVK